MNVQSKKLKEAKDRVRIKKKCWLRYSCKTLKLSLFISKYEKMSAKLVETKENLGAFKKGVEILENKETKRWVISSFSEKATKL